MEGPPLRCRRWRVIVLFPAAFVSIAGPTAGLLLLGLLGPPPFVLSQDAEPGAWVGAERQVEGAMVVVRRADVVEGAGKTADELAATVPMKRIDKTGHDWRYIRSDDGRAGRILPVDGFVLSIEGRDRRQVDSALAALPFIVENPEKNLVYELLKHHLGLFLWGVGIYVVLVAVAMARGAAWAASIEPPRKTRPLDFDALRSRLLEINELDVPAAIREKRPGRMTAEWRLADARWTGLFEKAGLTIVHRVTMRLDPERRIVRAIDSQRKVRWSAGVPTAAWSASFFRGIVFCQVEAGAQYGVLFRDDGWRVDAAYRYAFNLDELKTPVVAAIVLSGWTWRPVVTFLRPIGG